MLLKFLGVIGVIVAVAPLLLSWKSRGWISKFDSPVYTFDHIPDLSGKTAIVTGGNSGIGLVTARELARKGARVTLSARSRAKGDSAKNTICADLAPGQCQVDVITMDLASLESVVVFAQRFKDKHKSLDMLILNAGVMACPFQQSSEGYEMQFATNHLGHFLLTELLMPLLENAEAGRVVSVSSSAHQAAPPQGIRFDALDNDDDYSAFAAYGQSKLANILFSNELARRLKDRKSSVTSNALHPGFIQTNLGHHMLSAARSQSPLELLVSLGEGYVMSGAMSADDGALTQLYAATSPDMNGVSGEYLIPLAKKGVTTSLAMDKELQKKLWSVSEKMVENFI